MSADTAMNLSVVKRDPVAVEQNFSSAFSEKMQLSAKSDVLIRSLIDMYKDSMTAVIREYAANALDSHILAGQTRPIEVVLPSAYGNDCIIIRDYGVGLDEEGLRSYVHLGESSKGDDDSQTGFFGMGSKSGLALASQFTVIAVKDGMKRVVTIGENSEGGISLDGMKVVETDDPNGVTISIPVPADQIHEAQEKAGSLFRHWEPGTVLVNGVEPEHVSSYEGYHNVGNHHVWKSTNNYRSKRFYVKMGSVAYQVEMDLLPYELRSILYKIMSKYNVLMTVPAQSMDLVLNRDSVIYSARTLETIRTTTEEFFKTFVEKINSDIEAHMQKNALKEAATLYMDFVSVLSDIKKPSHKGVELDTTLEVMDQGDSGSRIVEAVRSAFGKVSYYGKKERQYDDRSTMKTLDQENMDNLHIVYIENDEYSRAVRGASDYIASQNIRTVVFALGDFKPKEWIDKLYYSITFDEFYEIVKTYRKENKPARGTGTTVARPVQYRVFTMDENEGVIEPRDLSEIRESEEKDYYFWDETESGTMPRSIIFAEIMNKVPYKPVILVDHGKKLQTMKNRFKNFILTDLRETLKTVIVSLDDEKFHNMRLNSPNSKFSIIEGLSRKLTEEMRDELGEGKLGRQVRDFEENIAEGATLTRMACLAFQVSTYGLKNVPEIEKSWMKAGEEMDDSSSQRFMTDSELTELYPLLGNLYMYYSNQEIKGIVEYIKAMDIMRNMQNQSA